MDNFEKGESISRVVTLTADGVPLDTDDFLTIEVKVSNFFLRLVATYSLADGTVDKIAPTTDGQIRFIIPETTSSAIRAIRYFYQVKTTETDTDYPGNIRTRMYLGWCFDLKNCL